MRKRIKLPIVLCLILSMLFGLSSIAFADNNPYVPNLTRYGGKNRYETANQIADAIDSDLSCNTIVIATASGFADALAGGPLAAALKAPILLSEPGGLNNETMAQIRKIAPNHAIILGGTGVVPTTVENQLSSLGISSDRLQGTNRYGTARAIAYYMYDMNGMNAFDSVFLVTADNYPDALSISPVAGIKGVPILYAPASGILDSDTYNLIHGAVNGTPYIIGGPTLIPETVANSAESATGEIHERIYGTNRYETSAKINLHFRDLFYDNALCIASGQNYPDALSGSVYAALGECPLLLVQNNKTQDCLNYIVRWYDPSRLFLFGGSGVVNDETALALTSVPSQIPDIEQTHALELRYLGSICNPYNSGSDYMNYMVEVQNVTYTTTPGSDSDHYNVTVDVTCKRTDTNTEGGWFTMDSTLYDQSNSSITGKVDSDLSYASPGSTFTLRTDFYDVPWGTYELYIESVYRD